MTLIWTYIQGLNHPLNFRFLSCYKVSKGMEWKHVVYYLCFSFVIRKCVCLHIHSHKFSFYFWYSCNLFYLDKGYILQMLEPRMCLRKDINIFSVDISFSHRNSDVLYVTGFNFNICCTTINAVLLQHAIVHY